MQYGLSPEKERHSPCVGTCRLDQQTGLCLGCARTGDEIANWSSLDAKARFAIWEQLPGRHATQSKRARLLPLTPDEILSWAARTVEERLGAWVTGTPGAVAEFMTAFGQTPHVELKQHQLTCYTDTGSLRLKRHDQMRAFAFEEAGPVVLGLARAAVDVNSKTVFTELGVDNEAGASDYRSHLLFDYGLGRKFSRFCIRTNKGSLIAMLRDFDGQPWQTLMAAVGPQIVAESPHRVVESALARIEVYAAIPSPSGRSPDGSHTHFLPAFLAGGEEISPSLALPDNAAPMAIFHPSRRQAV
jgi:predicted Fe-S protein YdhL (DUF1289 family)